MFAKRLDFMIKLTNVKARALAKACMIDISYVSKLRTGVNKLPKQPTFLENMSDFFVEHIKTEEQKLAFCHVLDLSSFPDDEQNASLLLKEWLLSKDSVTENDDLFFEKIFTRAASESSVTELRNTKKLKQFYYGINGKREAALACFDFVLQQDKPTTLYLNSEENMAWMQNDSEFIKLWTEKFTKVLLAGNKVVVIHNVKRGIDEILYAVAKWMKIYMIGDIESYYYSGIRDDVLQRTLFIAENLVSLSSVSVDKKSDNMLNQVIQEKKAVKALTKEFKNMLDLCKPFSKVVNTENIKMMDKILKSLAKQSLAVKVLSPMPSIFSMPLDLAESIQNKYPNTNLVNILNKNIKRFKNNINTSSFVEYIPDLECLLQAKSSFEMPFAEFLGDKSMSYTKEELIKHYENIKKLEKKYDNYKVVYIKEDLGTECLVSLANHGFVIANPFHKNIAVLFLEENIINAYNNFMSSKIINLEKVKLP